MVSVRGLALWGLCCCLAASQLLRTSYRDRPSLAQVQDTVMRCTEDSNVLSRLHHTEMYTHAEAAPWHLC